MKLKNIFLILVLTLVFVGCKKDDDGGNADNFDHAGQAVKDADILVTYLKTHHYIPPVGDEYFGKIDTITAGESVTSLFDDSNLKTHKTKFNEIDYTYYSYEQVKGSQNLYPTRLDSVLVRYKGVLLNKSKQFDKDELFSRWWPLYNVGGSIQGWRLGMQHFSGGMNNSTPDDPIDFNNTGKGFFIIPSGLAYRNGARSGIVANSPLVFHVDMGYVIIADNDNDGILNKYEDLNGDGEAFDDDTDGDRIPNYIDIDDDGDGTLTKDENPDPNGDGNPDDAKDSDNDGTPDYLDPDTK